MPIRLNLLAEAQAAEDARRRDPVKRGIWIGGFLIFCVLLWVGLLQVDIFQASSALKQQESKWSTSSNRYKEVTENRRKAQMLESRIAALDRLSTNRFLWGNVFNALQLIQTNSVLQQIQVMRLRAQQDFIFTEAAKAKTVGSKVTPATPSSFTEKPSMTLSARDYSNPTEETYNKYKAALSNSEFFQKQLRRKDGFEFAGPISPPQLDGGRNFVEFKVESHFPDAKRNE